jgi:hypothetical protein
MGERPLKVLAAPSQQPFAPWVAQSCDTDFQPSTTYKSLQGTSGADSGHPIFPQPSAATTDPSGQTLQTIPYFATDINGTHDYDLTNPNANIRNVQIPVAQDQILAYYGCFLDIYDANGNANLGGTHHCIVAEIAYSLAPIPTATATGGAPSPLSWDQLAQRNLQITLSENPKSRATHIAPQAFDIRPSKMLIPLPGQPIAYPDELMIDWGKTPPGSVATIYWPGLSSSKVLALAHSIYASHLLSAADGYTIQCVTTRGVTYIPIPHVPNVNFAGLLTIDLPATITHGEVFDIMVRRVTSLRGRLAPPPPPPKLNSPPSKDLLDRSKSKAHGHLAAKAEKHPGFNWPGVRRVQRAHPGHQRQGHAAPGRGHAGHPQVAAEDEAGTLSLAAGVGALRRTGGRKGKGPGRGSRPDPAVARRLSRQGRTRPSGTPSGP